MWWSSFRCSQQRLGQLTHPALPVGQREVSTTHSWSVLPCSSAPAAPQHPGLLLWLPSSSALHGEKEWGPTCFSDTKLLSLIQSCLIEVWVLEAVAGKYGNNNPDLLNCFLRAAWELILEQHFEITLGFPHSSGQRQVRLQEIQCSCATIWLRSLDLVLFGRFLQTECVGRRLQQQSALRWCSIFTPVSHRHNPGQAPFMSPVIT